MTDSTLKYFTDKAEIDEALKECPMGELWTLVRKGLPGSRVRILWRYRDRARAHARFARERAKMRQGMLALVGPDGSIWSYHSEPMPRRRW
jgi:hypothetical protein